MRGCGHAMGNLSGGDGVVGRGGGHVTYVRLSKVKHHSLDLTMCPTFCISLHLLSIERKRIELVHFLFLYVSS